MIRWVMMWVGIGLAFTAGCASLGMHVVRSHLHGMGLGQ